MDHSVEKSRLSGCEKFLCNGVPVTDWEDPTIRSFWSWYASDLNDNTTRGGLAEYYVALALNPSDPFQPRTRPWTSWDIETEEGIKIEVKTTGIRQSWHDESDGESIPQWDIPPVSVYDWDSKSYSTSKSRPSDVYVCCLHLHRDRSTLDATDLSQWKFYVISTKVLEDERPKGQTIRLNPLKKLGAEETDFVGLKAAILRAANAE